MTYNIRLTPQEAFAPRKQPTQQRAKERVERILRTAAALLDEVGVDGLTTNLIAARADVQVASVYQYFPNKYAILIELARQAVEEQLRQIDAFIGDAGFTRPWTNVLDEIFDALLPGGDAQAGAVAIRLAVAALPELADVREWERRTVAARLVSALKAAGARAPEQQLYTVAVTLFATATAVLNEAMQSDPSEAANLIAELKTLHRSYLRQYLP